MTFPFEEHFNEVTSNKYMRNNWTFSIYCAIVYVILVFTGKRYMKNRPRYNLRFWLMLWSSVLAIYSIMGTVRTLPPMYYIMSTRGFRHSICDIEFFKGVSGFWTYAFVLSKVYELGDTAFIILRKQPLSFLHWYHHATAMIFAWYSYSDFSATCKWFVVMNYTVHSIMYTYYALRANGIFVPKFISIVITTLQMSQMFVACAASVYGYQLNQRGENCNQTLQHLQVSIFMYFSYFILFAHFFYSRYVSSESKKKRMELTSEKEKAK